METISTQEKYFPLFRDNATFSVVAENSLGSSTRDWRLSLVPEVVPRRLEDEEEEEDVYEDLVLPPHLVKDVSG